MRKYEIERNFLIRPENVAKLILSERPYLDIVQGYMPQSTKELVYRLRQTIQMAPSTTILGAEQFYQTIKGSGNITRLEAEIELMKPQFHELWHLCKNDTVHKNRYAVKLTEGKKYKDSYLDVYKHDFEGLFTFEVEFNTEKESKDFVSEPWFYREISKLDEYKNFNLAIAKKLPDDFLNDKNLT